MKWNDYLRDSHVFHKLVFILQIEKRLIRKMRRYQIDTRPHNRLVGIYRKIYTFIFPSLTFASQKWIPSQGKIYKCHWIKWFIRWNRGTKMYLPYKPECFLYNSSQYNADCQNYRLSPSRHNQTRVRKVWSWNVMYVHPCYVFSGNKLYDNSLNFY